MDNDLFRATIRKYLELRHTKNLQNLSKHTTVSCSTLYRYFDDPGKIPIEVFLQVMKALNVPHDEWMEILKGGEN